MNTGYNNVQGVLEGTKQFVVPLFQRGYSWKPKHWQMLWSDIMRLYEGEEQSHFLGAIVTAPMDGLPDQTTKHLLIDGQQRLTTITLLLSALRDVALSSEQQLARQITEEFLVNRFHEEDERFKVLPTQLDRDSFAEIVQGKPRTHKTGIRRAYKYFKTELQTQLERPGEGFDLRKLFKQIVNSLYVVMIQLSREDNPYFIFESLNAKGAPLTAADLIRNYVFMKMPDAKEQEKAHRKLWLPMEKRLGDQQRLTTFMRQVVMRTGVMVRRDDIYGQLQRYLTRRDARSPREELEAMSAMSELYLRMIEPAKERTDDLRVGFQTILDLEVTTSHPLVLRLYGLYEIGQVKVHEFAELLKSIASFMVRRVFGLYSTRPLAVLFVQITRELDEEKPLESVLSLLDKAGWPDDKTFEAGFLTTPIYQFDQNKTAFVLRALERSFGHKEAASLARVTVEHVFPQNPKPSWMDKLGSEAFATTQEAMHQIGNLTLSAYNTELSNRWFEDKKSWYARSKLELNKYFEAPTTWDAEQIRVRGTALFKRAKVLWRKPTWDAV